MDKNIAIGPEELKKRLDRNDVMLIFDLRNRDEFESWRIEGRGNMESLNIPQTDFAGEEEKYLDRLPRDRQIITICAHGDAARYSAELLLEKGFDAVSILGGMDLWSEFYETRKVSDLPEIYQIYRTAKGCMSYVVISGGEAVVIDAVRHVERILSIAEAAGARVIHVFDTHLQADHISGGREIAERLGVPYHISGEDAAGAAYAYDPLRDGESFSFGKCVLDVVNSPGHTPGSTSFLLDRKFLFTGDTIMKTSIGRPDLGGKADDWALLLYDTLFRRYSILSDDIVILPSHAASITEQDEKGIVRLTLGQARRESELFNIRDTAAFVGRIKSTLLENPARYQDIRKVNLGILTPDEQKRKELEIGKNLCGMAGKK